MNTIEEKLVADLEVALFDPNIHHLKERLNELLADDFIEFTSSGKKTTKADTITSLSVERNLKISPSNLQATMLSPDLIQVTYEARKTDTSNGSVKDSFRSSIWKKNGSQWQIIFHQGTPKAN